MKMATAGWSVAGVLVTGVGVYAFFQPQAVPPSVTTRNSASVVRPAPLNLTRPPDAQSTSQQTPQSTPAWLTPASPSAPMSTSATLHPEMAQSARLSSALARLQHLQATGLTDPRQFADALLQVEQANGSPNLQGVRLDVLRQNLEVAGRMKELATQMTGIQPSDKSPLSAEAAVALHSKMDQLVALQKQLRSDVLQTVPATDTRP